MKVYLAGGLRSKWRVVVQKGAPSHDYINPEDHGLDAPAEYTCWDTLGVTRADLVFAYMEHDNPSGIGLALEVGLGLGTGATVVVVGGQDTEYFEIVREAADLAFDTLDDGLAWLQSAEAIP